METAHRFFNEPLPRIMMLQRLGESFMAHNSDGEKVLRVLITSDIHHTYDVTWYGVGTNERVQLWADSIKAEHERDPIDLIIIAGDPSLDHYLFQGAYTVKGVGDTVEFMERYFSQLPKDIPYFIGAGNHELYNDAQWRGYVGNGRQGVVTIGDDMFIMLDTWRAALEPDYDGKIARYTPVEVDFLEEQLEKYSCPRVWLVAHYFELAHESEEFKRIVRENDRIKGLFQGHTHRCSLIPMGEEYGNKTIAETGNFSYASATFIKGSTIDDVKNSFWGFRELIISSDHAESNYIIAKSNIATFRDVKLDIERRLVDSITYQY